MWSRKGVAMWLHPVLAKSHVSSQHRALTAAAEFYRVEEVQRGRANSSSIHPLGFRPKSRGSCQALP